MRINKKIAKIKHLVTNQVINSKQHKLVIGISGGVDSAVTLALLISWFGKDKILPYYLPIEQKTDFDDVLLLGQQLNIQIQVVDLTNEFIDLKNKFNFHNQININNIKSRLRAMFLYGVALENNSLVVGCLNYDEYYLGYFTKYGDSCADIFPIINFCKSEIYQVAKMYNLPQNIINKKPSAGLYPNQTDEQELGLKYSEIDDFLWRKKINSAIASKIKEIKRKNSHKHLLNSFLIKNKLRKI